MYKGILTVFVCVCVSVYVITCLILRIYFYITLVSKYNKIGNYLIYDAIFIMYPSSFGMLFLLFRLIKVNYLRN